jgi:uncharacterized membrane protein
MARVSKSIVIEAPVSKVFSYMNNPKNLPEIWPSMVEVRDVQKLPNGGMSFYFVYKMAGVRLEGFSEDTEFNFNHCTVTRSSGGINGQMTLVYEATGQAARVTLVDEYRLPEPVVGKLAEELVIRINEFEAEALLANLKTRMEA